MLPTRIPVLLSLFLMISLHVYSQIAWAIDKDKEGVKVYTRVEEHSEFKSFKAVMTVAASMDEILKILKDADGYSKWYGFTKTSRLLKQEKNVQYNYVETIFPWPYKNRDMVYRMSWDTINEGAIRIALQGVPDYIGVKGGIVRMKKAVGYILLQHSQGITEVIYEFHSEPGDNVPPWLANNSIAELPFKTFSGLKKMLNKKEK